MRRQAAIHDFRVSRTAARRRGALLVELLVCGVILGGIALSAAPILLWIGRTRQAAERQQVAVLAVGNLMERLTASPWEDLTPERVAAVRLPESLARQLPEHVLEVTVIPDADEPAAREIRIALRWEESPRGVRSPPVRLSAWVYQPQQVIE